MMMDPARWTYDPTVDAAYAQVSDKPIKRTEELADGVIIDYDADGKVVGIELLDIMDALNAASGKPRVLNVSASGAIVLGDVQVGVQESGGA